MEIKTILADVMRELEDVFENLDEGQLRELESRVKKADKIFVAGAGRSLMMIRGFAMRLMHMGFTAYVVGETVTPAIGPGDLLLIASGSGETGTLTVMAEKCKKTGAELALITTNPSSAIGNLADCVTEVPAASTKCRDNKRKSIQPGANTFEQSVLLIGDAMVIDMISDGEPEKTNRVLMKRHANLE